MTTWQGVNRRQYPRIVYPCLVKLFTETQGQEVFLTHTENISVKGCHIIAKKEVKALTTITVEFDLLDDEDHMVIEGRVAWAAQRKSAEIRKPLFFDVGINFTKISDVHKARLERVISNLVKKGHTPLKPVY